MTNYAQKEAQAAYIDSLQTMTPADLIKEVMRVQIAAASLVNDEFKRGYYIGHKDGWLTSGEGFNSEVGCSEDEYESIVDSDFDTRLSGLDPNA